MAPEFKRKVELVLAKGLGDGRTDESWEELSRGRDENRDAGSRPKPNEVTESPELEELRAWSGVSVDSPLESTLG